MKKLFFIFAAAAMMTACNSNTTATENPTTNDSTPVEQETEEAVVEKMGPCTVESNELSLDVPEGWKVVVGDFDEITMTKNREDGMTQKIEVSLIPKTAAARIDDLFTSGGFEKGAAVKIGDKTYLTVRSESNEFYHSVADWGEEKCLDITTNFIKPEAPEVNAAVSSVKLK